MVNVARPAAVIFVKLTSKSLNSRQAVRLVKARSLNAAFRKLKLMSRAVRLTILEIVDSGSGTDSMQCRRIRETNFSLQVKQVVSTPHKTDAFS